MTYHDSHRIHGEGGYGWTDDRPRPTGVNRRDFEHSEAAAFIGLTILTLIAALWVAVGWLMAR